MPTPHPIHHPLRHAQRLDELLNFRLYLLHTASSAPVVRLLEGRYGITRREWRLLALLADRGALSPSDLAFQGQLDRARTSRSIGVLVEKKWAERTALPSDPRRARISLTPAGQSLYDTVFPQIADINAQLVSVLDDATLQTVNAALAQLTARAQALSSSLAADIKIHRHQGGSRRLLAQQASRAPKT